MPNQPNQLNQPVVAVIFGGQSAEHEVSIRSAQAVHAALLSAGFSTVRIAIDKHGVWRLAPCIRKPQDDWPQVVMLPGGGGEMLLPGGQTGPVHVDVAFPVLHGPLGEDGSVQGLLRMCQVACVGCDLLSSALCMDKVYAKRMLAAAGLPTAKSLVATAVDRPSYADAIRELGSPFFVKPANMGSSIGVSQVVSELAYAAALKAALRLDTTVLIEQRVSGREIEVAVMSDSSGSSNSSNLTASLPGEIITTGADFYHYDAKYSDEDGASLVYPAPLPIEATRRIQAMAIAASQTLGCDGLVRVDFFLDEDGSLTINELNTMPGFTDASMYPKLWATSGKPMPAVVTTLVNHALVRAQAHPARPTRSRRKKPPLRIPA